MNKNGLKSTEVEVADVFCDGVRCGRLERTKHGSSFRYEPSFLNRTDRPRGGIATQLPYQEEPIRTEGVNLHPFFAGLLPEGLRLEAVVAKARTSRDDLFSILIEAGPDCVGDVYVLPQGRTENPDVATVDLAGILEIGFDEAEAAFLQGARDASIPGVQPKLSAALLSRPVGSYGRFGPSLLKLSPAAYPGLVENEQFCMRLAYECDLIVPKTKIVTDRSGRSGLLVERFDRRAVGVSTRRIHQEDACQFCNRYPADKYRLSLREVTESLVEHSEVSAVALYRLCKLYAFSYVIGNADLHAKNISLFRSDEFGPLTLTPAYDLVCTLAYPQLDTRMALALDGKDDNFKIADFVEFFVRFGEKEAVVRDVLSKIVSTVRRHLDEFDSISSDSKIVRRIRQEVDRRLKRLSE